MIATTLAVPIVDLAAVSRAFPLLGRFQGGVPHGSGHINDTFAVTYDQAGAPVRYIFQRINHRIFGDVPALMENIDRVSTHTAARMMVENPRDAARRALTLVRARDGRPYHRDDLGNYWRCYLFIEKAQTYDVIGSPQQARAGAKAFGQFQNLLVDLPGDRLSETIPYFHDTRRRFELLRGAVLSDICGRRNSVAEEIEFAFRREDAVDTLQDLLARGEIPERITHNDTKLNNVMIDDVTQEGVCVIDLDTVMPGLALHDFGDMVRSATNSVAEDERDRSRVQVRLEIFEALVEGYLEAARAFLNDAECAHLVTAGRLMTYEVGIRFLTDFLQGDIYFKTKRSGHNLDRARNQFTLLRRMEERASEMEAVVHRVLGA
ncbi:MAG TPA: aminoglycoside phosphotransferase family protein [Opitutaceae bacterium]